MATSAKKVELTSIIKVAELFAGTLMSADDKEVTQKIEDNIILKSDTTPDCEFVHAARHSLTAGAKTIDLTALTDGSGATIASTGKKVIAVKFKALSTNTAAITISEGAADGYELLGNGFTLALKPKQHALLYMDTGAPDVAANAKNIALAGTGTESLDIIFVFG